MLESQDDALTVTDLRAEYTSKLPGTEIEQPSLSWRVESARRGVEQVRYRIRIATSENALAAGAGIVATMLFTAWSLMSNYEIMPDALQFHFDLYYTAIIGNLVMFVVGFSIGCILQRRY